MVDGKITVVQMLPELISGGVERGTLEIGKYLVEQGHRSIVISGGGRMVSQLEEEGSQHVRWSHIGEKSPRALKYLLPLRKLLIREKVDILHLRSRLPAWIGFLAWKTIPASVRPGLVTTVHGFYSVNKYSAIMTKGDKIIAVSDAIADQIIKDYSIDKSNISLIYRGFDENMFDPESISGDRLNILRQAWDLKESGTPVILFPGRFTRLKGHDLFFRSLSKIKHLPWTAICLGDFDKSSYTNDLVDFIKKSGMEEKVRFVGHCSDMPAAFILSDIVVSASVRPESFGRVILEAQAMGKPIIASAHGGSLETVLDRRTGWLVTPCNAVDLAYALREAILDNKLRTSLGKNGRKWASENFTTQKMCKKTLDIYLELVNTNQRSL